MVVLQGIPEPACAFGDAVVFVRSVSPNDPSAGFKATIRDGATGAVRAAIDAKPSAKAVAVTAEKYVKVGYWKDGSPALLVRSVAQTGAEGLKAETTRTTLTMYAPSPADTPAWTQRTGRDQLTCRGRADPRHPGVASPAPTIVSRRTCSAARRLRALG